jgi:hypothetical protein
MAFVIIIKRGFTRKGVTWLLKKQWADHRNLILRLLAS